MYKDKDKEDFVLKLDDYIFNQKNFTLFNLNNFEKNFFNEDFLTEKQFFLKQFGLSEQYSTNPNINKNILRNKVINYSLEKGKKLTSYKIFNNTFQLFYSFFDKFNDELNNSYELYSTYYKYSIKNKTIFFEPMFIYYNLISFLQPSFIISFKKTLKTKKNNKKAKEVIINYIKPKSRFFFCLKSIIKFSKTFSFNKCNQNIAYTLLNLFLLNKNSSIYKKKIIAYEKLIKLKKTK